MNTILEDYKTDLNQRGINIPSVVDFKRFVRLNKLVVSKEETEEIHEWIEVTIINEIMKKGTPHLKEALLLKVLDRYHNYRDEKTEKLAIPVSISLTPIETPTSKKTKMESYESQLSELLKINGESGEDNPHN